MKKKTKKSNRPVPVELGNGFVLRVARGPHRDNNQVWYFKVAKWTNGKDRAHSCFWATLEDALAKARLYVSNPLLEIPPIQNLIEKWFASQAFTNLTEHTRRKYSVIGRLYLPRLFPQQYPTFENVANAIETLKAEGKSSNTIAGVLIGGSAFHKWAKANSLVKGLSPFIGHDLDNFGEKVKHTPSQIQVDKLVTALTGQEKLIVQIISDTGMRIGEISRLNWSDLDFDSGQIMIRGKAGKIRFIQMSPELRMLLEPLKSTGLIFPAQTTTHAVIYRQLNEACLRLGLPKYTPHSFRRYLIDRFRRKGVPPQITAKWSGNSPNVIFKFYETVAQDELRDAAATVFGVAPEQSENSSDGAKTEPETEAG